MTIQTLKKIKKYFNTDGINSINIDVKSMNFHSFKTDGGENMNKTARLLNQFHLPFFTHKFNRIVKVVLTNISIKDIIDKGRDLVSAFDFSPKINAKMTEIQLKLSMSKKL